MTTKNSDEMPSAEELRDLARTLTAVPARDDELVLRLEHVADLLADSGPLPPEPVLVWRETGGVVRHAAIGGKLVVSRRAEGAGLVLPEDKLLSRPHFSITASDQTCELADLESHNGTAVNQIKNQVQRRILRDGDLIFAGAHIFAFLDGRQKT